MCFNLILLRFHFCVGISILQHDFGGEILHFNLYRCQCKFVKERTEEHVYFPGNLHILL